MPFDPATLAYNDAGLIPVIAQDATSDEVLMLAWMNADAVARTLESGQVTYWSRSRREFWIKGATSGNTQGLVEMRVDCDADCLSTRPVRPVIPARIAVSLRPSAKPDHPTDIARRCPLSAVF
jgi:phosphoribosyl-AMP cyclohydrolase